MKRFSMLSGELREVEGSLRRLKGLRMFKKYKTSTA
jgi:hypothetical protein